MKIRTSQSWRWRNGMAEYNIKKIKEPTFVYASAVCNATYEDVKDLLLCITHPVLLV